MNSYELSRNWFDWCFENPEKINTNHHAIYFFAIEHCNRLGWKEKFGFPSQMTMDAIGIKNYRTYIKAFNDLVEFGFIDLIKKSSNQYSANIIAIVKNTKATTKALDNAFTTHNTKQSQSNVSINKQSNNITNKQKNNIPDFDTFLNHALTIEPNIDKVELRKKYDAWINNNWHDGNGKKITIWKSKLNSTIPYISKKPGVIIETEEQMLKRRFAKS
jgi:hypothetical protein